MCTSPAHVGQGVLVVWELGRRRPSTSSTVAAVRRGRRVTKVSLLVIEVERRRRNSYGTFLFVEKVELTFEFLRGAIPDHPARRCT